MSKDWTGNQKSIYTTLGASNHTDKEREINDYYATDPRTLEPLLEKEKLSNNIWECACGGGYLSEALKLKGYNVKSTDLVDRNYGVSGVDFLEQIEKYDGDILTNPPYKYALEFVEKALELIPVGNKVVMFLKLTFLEGQKRRRLFDTMQLAKVYVFSDRQSCAMNGEFDKYPLSAVAYGWFVWIKGYHDLPRIEWIDTLTKNDKQMSIFDFLEE